jgi:hypothetical protein
MLIPAQLESNPKNKGEFNVLLFGAYEKNGISAKAYVFNNFQSRFVVNRKI